MARTSKTNGEVAVRKALLGDAYHFQWQPKTKEEGAPV